MQQRFHRILSYRLQDSNCPANEFCLILHKERKKLKITTTSVSKRVLIDERDIRPSLLL
jgi:hypothetical protein